MLMMSSKGENQYKGKDKKLGVGEGVAMFYEVSRRAFI